MKNLKISKKILCTFGVVIVLFIVAVGSCVYALSNANQKMEEFYSHPYQAISLGGELMTNLETSAKEMASILWVGDSRTAGMRNALATLGITDSCTFIAKDGEGFRWFKESALPELNAALSQNPDTIVVSNMGVNDLADLDAYISLYYELFDQYPDTRFYILSVNPADEDCTMVSNRDIETFNAGMYAEFPSRYLDCYNYLKQTGYETVDGLHYTEETYQKIHDFATSKVSD